MQLPNDISECHTLIKELYATNQKLVSVNEHLQVSLVQMQSIIDLLNKKIEDLESRLNKNSKNSHKPPSSDGYKKQKSIIPKKKGTRGGQRGHKGKTLEIVGKPDHTHILSLEGECSCGKDLSKLKTHPNQTRRVFDLPPPELIKTDYIQLQGVCSCGKVHQSNFPSTVQAPTQYGSSVRAFTTLLTQDGNLSASKTKQLFEDLYGYSINESTIQNNNVRCYENLAETEEYIKQSVIDSIVSHFDETGLRVAGALQWLHVACTELFTFLTIHAKRGKEAMDHADVLPKAKGWIVHDRWASYFSYGEDKHAICIAHLLRDLTALDEQGNLWAKQFIQLLLTLYELTKQGTDKLNTTQSKQALKLYKGICKFANQIEPMPVKQPNKRGRPKSTKGRNLLNHLIEYQEAVLAFAFNKEVPFTNNLAERAIRPAKIKQKVSGCLRTFQGAERYARIRGFVDTTRKHNRNVFKELVNIFEERSFLLEKEST